MLRKMHRALLREQEKAVLKRSGGYLPALPSWLDTFENVFLSWPPRLLTTPMMATEMPAAMSPYSIAVAPLSSCRKRLREVMLRSEYWLRRECSQYPCHKSLGDDR